MLRTLAALMIFISLFISGCRPSPPAGRAPDFTLPDQAGNQVSLRQLTQTRLVLVSFWASWCPPCRSKLPELERMHQELAGQGFTIVGISLDANPDDAREFLAGQPVTFPILFDTDGSSARAFGVRGIPNSVLVGQDRTILFRSIGYSPAGMARLRQAIRDALESAK